MSKPRNNGRIHCLSELSSKDKENILKKMPQIDREIVEKLVLTFLMQFLYNF